MKYYKLELCIYIITLLQFLYVFSDISIQNETKTEDHVTIYVMIISIASADTSSSQQRPLLYQQQ